MTRIGIITGIIINGRIFVCDSFIDNCKHGSCDKKDFTLNISFFL